VTFAINQSENIFEIIGNYPVVDQFDVLYPNLLTGSMYDHYVTGSMLPKVGSTATRGRVFSKLGVNPQTLPSIKGSIRASNEYQPFREKANFVKVLRIFSDSERFYDSMPPSLNLSLAKLNSSIFYTVGAGGEFAYAQVTPAWNARFPFSPLFNDVPRSRNVFTFVATDSVKTKSFQKVVVVDGLRKEDGTIYLALEWHNTNSYTVFGSPYDGAIPQDILKTFFGFGDSSYRENGFDKNLSVKVGGLSVSSHRPVYRYIDGSDPNINIAVAPIIRGWKYGLCSAFPHYTSAVFRRDRFGQFRDMLEQRQVAITRADSVYSPTNYFGEEEKPVSTGKYSIISEIPDTIDDFVVKVSFLQQTTVIVPPTQAVKLIYNNEDPINTWSSNLSTYVTSSLPYFDGIQTNRPNNALVPPTIV
jgi:hypothetical protein